MNDNDNENDNDNDTPTKSTTTSTTSGNVDAISSDKNNSIIPKSIMECLVFGLPLPVYCTMKYQSETITMMLIGCRVSVSVSRFIIGTMMLYGIGYGFLRYFDTFLQPTNTNTNSNKDNNTLPLSLSWSTTNTRRKKSPNKNDNKNDNNNKNGKATATATNTDINTTATHYDVLASEWRSRLLAIINALILIGGSILCFMEWSSYIPESEGWVSSSKDNNSTPPPLPSLSTQYPTVFASVFVGYLQWDVLWLIYHRNTHRTEWWGSFIHHVLFISISQYVLSGTYFRKPYAWLSVTELSTPFLHLRWLLVTTTTTTNTTTPYTGSNRNDNNDNNASSSSSYYYDCYYHPVSLVFAMTFLGTRFFGYGVGLLDLWQSYHYWNHSTIGLKYGVVTGLHVGYVLNLFWSYKVLMALVRALHRRKRQPTIDDNKKHGKFD